jgi:hypothetical protein
MIDVCCSCEGDDIYVLYNHPIYVCIMEKKQNEKEKKRER